MSTSQKLNVLGAVLLGDFIAGTMVARRLIAEEKFTTAAIIVVALALGWVFLAVVLLLVI